MINPEEKILRVELFANLFLRAFSGCDIVFQDVYSF